MPLDPEIPKAADPVRSSDSSAPEHSSFHIRQSSLPDVNAQHPWLGLLPYKEEHRDFFFGRDREVEDILGRIRDNSLTILYGQSGLGKSSLVAAGVVPRLREAGYAPVIVRLSYAQDVTGAFLPPLPDATDTRGRNAPTTLLDQTRACLSPSLPISESPGLPTTLWQHFHLLSTPSSPIPVLIFDQFEEIFTLGAQPQFADEVSDWLEQMANLLQNRPPRQLAERFAQDHALAEQYHFCDAPVRIVFTLREDYLAQLERWKAQLPLLMQNRMALTLLTGPQARQAVLGPAQLGDHSLVSREVAESIVRTVARVPSDTPLDQIKAVPPLLSLLCEQLNAARFTPEGERPQISAESVRDQAADILQRFYEDSFLSFPQEHRSRIRAQLEDPPMITEGGFRNALVRDDAENQLSRAGVPKAEAKAIFDTLIQRRLLTAETRDQVQRLEITHDVLVPLLLRSRKERQDREAKEQAERAALAAKAEQARLAKERRRLRFVAAAMTVLAIAAIGFAAYGWWQAKLARKAESIARDSEIKARESRSAAEVSTKAAEEARQQAQASADKEKIANAQTQTAATKEKAANEKNLITLHEACMADYAVAAQRIEKDNKWSEGVAHLARSLKWEPSNSLAATRLYDTLSLYAAEKQTWPRKILRHEYRVNSAQFSPDGTRIVTASSDYTARVWDAASGKPIGGPLLHEDVVMSAQFSPEGTRIVTASDDQTARVWDAATGKSLGLPLRHESGVNSAQFSADGIRIVTASSDNTARVWDAASGKPIGEPLRHEHIVVSALFSPNGTRVVTASRDNIFDNFGEARVWDATNGKPLGKPMRQQKSLNSVQFSSDGMLIVTASNDNTARVWDVATSKPLGEPLRHEDIVRSAQFSADGTRIVTASSDNTARVWDAGTVLQLPLPVPEWVLQRARAIAGLEFDADGQMNSIPADQRLTILYEPVLGDDSWAKLARWVVLPANERTLTPESKFTCRQIAERERDSGFKEGLESALRYDSTVPLAHLLLAKFEENQQRAAFLREYELKRLPEDAALWTRAATSLVEQKDFKRALQAAEKALKLDPLNADAKKALEAAKQGGSDK